MATVDCPEPRACTASGAWHLIEGRGAVHATPVHPRYVSSLPAALPGALPAPEDASWPLAAAGVLREGLAAPTRGRAGGVVARRQRGRPVGVVPHVRSPACALPGVPAHPVDDDGQRPCDGDGPARQGHRWCRLRAL